MGGTDCALPMIYAKQKKLKIDVFIVYTDSETWFGKIHPTEALKQYRRVCVCVCASHFVIHNHLLYYSEWAFFWFDQIYVTFILYLLYNEYHIVGHFCGI